MGDRVSKRRVVMAKVVALRWLQDHTYPEYRLKVYYGPKEIRGVPSLLRSFRDGKLRIGSIESISDLGIREEFDHFVIWSSDQSGLVQLREWFEKRDFETSGIW